MDYDYLDMIVKIAAAIILGGVIGIERESTNRPAGLRTHIIVCVGATVVMYTNLLLFKQYNSIVPIDPGRIGAQVVSGLGFIGAGTIIKEGASIKGLTTAASLWAVGCIGLAIGAGYLELSAITTVILLIVLQSFGKLEDVAIEKRRELTLYIEILGEKNKVDNIVSIFRETNCRVKTISTNLVNVGVFGIRITVRYPKDVDTLELITKVATQEGVITVERVEQ